MAGRTEEDGERGAKQSPRVADVLPFSDLRLDVSLHTCTSPPAASCPPVSDLARDSCHH